MVGVTTLPCRRLFVEQDPGLHAESPISVQHRFSPLIESFTVLFVVAGVHDSEDWIHVVRWTEHLDTPACQYRCVTSGRIRQNIRSVESAAIAGVLYSVLAVVALMLLQAFPDSVADSDALGSWFTDPQNRLNLIIGVNLAAISSIAFLWFVAVIRRRMGEREDRFISTVFLGSGILYIGVWLVAAASVSSIAFAFQRFEEASIDSSTTMFLVGFAEGLILVVAPRLQGAFVLSTSTLILRTQMLPRWLAYVGYVVGLAMLLTPLVYEPVGLGFPLWVLIVSVTILVSKSAHDRRDGHAGDQSL